LKNPFGLNPKIEFLEFLKIWEDALVRIRDIQILIKQSKIEFFQPSCHPAIQPAAVASMRGG
jgi:hypothetical protein